MTRLLLLGACFGGLLLLSGLPLISQKTGQAVPNYQIHEDGSVSPLQQSENAWLVNESNIRYDRSQLNELDRQKRGAVTAP